MASLANESRWHVRRQPDPILILKKPKPLIVHAQRMHGQHYALSIPLSDHGCHLRVLREMNMLS